MKLFEFEAKGLLGKEGVRVPRGVVVGRGEDPRLRIEEAGLSPPLMVKSQVLVAGRGRAGGVRKADSISEAVRLVERLLETPIKGLLPEFILVEEALEHERELYAAITIDKSEKRPVALASVYGGMEIEDIVREKPDSMVKLYLNPYLGLREYEARLLGKRLGLAGEELRGYSRLLTALYRVFEAYDADLVECNPIAVVNGEFVALDARIIMDDNAVYRHPEIAGVERGHGEASEWEARARSLGLSFVELEGTIGIIGNGAGLTMTTMDLVYNYGGSPANFLDIGGGASSQLVKKAVLFLLEYPKAEKIFINIFGGITRGDEVARGIVEAVREAGGLKKPMVVRLTGTREEEGRRILGDAGIRAYVDPVEAVKAVLASGG